MRKTLALLLVLCISAAQCGCGVSDVMKLLKEGAQSPEKIEELIDQIKDPDAEPQPETQYEPEPDPVLEMIESMTLREKVGQLFMIVPEALCFDPVSGKASASSPTEVNATMTKAYEAYPCGGFCLFKANITDPEQIKKFNSELHALGSIRPLISVDEEGGTVSRISGRSEFGIDKIPAMMTVAASGDTQDAYDIGAKIGKYLKEYGFDMDFAPVADVFTNPKNKVIGTRAFGSDPLAAAEMVSMACEGLQSEEIMCCLKHFPGHGNTSTDSHSGYAETDKTWDELLECEIIPFAAGIAAGSNFIMAAHICAPNVTGDKTPASLSHLLLTEKLRNELGYEGIIITDSLAMGAITQVCSPAEAAVKALQAGADMLLMPQDYRQAFDGVVKAVEAGDLTEERINESLERILRIKQ